MDFPQLIVGELGDVAIRVDADASGFAYRIEDRPDRLDIDILTADEHQHVAPDRGIDRAGHGHEMARPP